VITTFSNMQLASIVGLALLATSVSAQTNASYVDPAVVAPQLAGKSLILRIPFFSLEVVR
jgi:hypothetical protein